MLRRGIALLFKRRDFGLLMATQFCAQAGDGLVQGALTKLIVFGGHKGFDIETARSPEELLRIVLLVFVPYTILSPFLGVVIDRWDRRRLLFLANGLRAAIVVVVGLSVSAAGNVGLIVVFLLTLASTRIVLATKAAALPATLDGEPLVEANAISQLGGSLTQLSGVAIALAASKFVSSGPIIVLGGLVYAAGAFVALQIRRTGEARAVSRFAEELARVVRSIADGVREVASKPKAAAAITTYFWLRLLWSFTIVGIGFIARSLLANNNLQLALVIGGAGAIGAALGFLLAARLHERVRSSANLVLAASMITGVMIAVTGGFRSKPSIAVVAFFLGLGFFLTKISLDTMVQEALGDDFRGRAFSLYDISYNLAWVVAAGAMEIVWGRVSGGLLIAGMGVVFLAGIAGIAAWFKRAGLLTPRSVTIEAR